MSFKTVFGTLALSLLFVCLCANAEEPSPTPEPQLLPDNVMARANRHDIRVEDFNRSLLEKVGKNSLEFLITAEIVEQLAGASGLELDEAVVDNRLEDFGKQIAPLTLEQYFQRTGVSSFIFSWMMLTDATAEALARADLAIPDEQPLPEEQAHSWYTQVREKASVQMMMETKPDGVAAIVNEVPISTKKWVEVTRQMTQPMLQAQILDDLINKELIRDELKKVNIVITDDDVEREIAARKKLFEDDPRSAGMTYEEFLGRTGQSAESLKDSEKFRLSLGVGRLIQRQLSQADINEYFEQHRKRFAGPVVRASHILLRAADPEANQPDYEKALAQIRDIKEKLDKGADFAALAAEFSEDPGSRPRGGDLGYFAPGDMVEEFSKTAFSLEKGALSEPVKTQFGYHLILVTDVIPEKDVKLDDVNEQIVRELTEQRRPAFVKALRESAEIQRNPKLLQPVPLQ